MLSAGVPDQLASALAERYDLHRVLGRGGMATVYLAHDRKHHRDVALKVLLPELAASLGADRFLKEIDIVSRLTHPHILPLHDSGEASGFVYYVMPFISGGSLRPQVGNDRPMTVERALGVAAPVADALAYAHGLGVLHRDIKPENILFSHGHPVVADFGIARAVTSASDTHLTRTGIALGTPGYMSPEQAAGFATLDERTDVYSLAVVVYEMLVGEIPGHWPSEDAVRAGRFLEAPEAHRARLAAAGAAVEAALVHGLSVQQGQRTASAEALVADLRSTGAPRKKYRTEEVNEIVKRASEMEASNPTAGAMTIGGVVDVARQVGIAPELVRSAARAVAGGSGGAVAPPGLAGRDRFLGRPRRIYFETVVDGELSEADFPIVVNEIRRVLGSTGQVSQLGKSFSWVMARGSNRRDFEVAVTARAGTTRITVSENLSALGEQVFAPIMVAAGLVGAVITTGVVGGALHTPWALPVALPAWLGAVYVWARAAYRSQASRREREATEVRDRVNAVVGELVEGGRRLPGPEE